jgi:hypothetical protein
MRESYGIVWREGDLPPVTGKLELLTTALRLDGLSDSQSVQRDVDYGSLAAVRVGRSAADRLDGRPTIILERRRGEPITISTVARPSLVTEIAERLTRLQLGAARSTAFVLPFKEDAYEAVRALLDTGPPFDPAETPGLDRHEVFLTSSEVVFVFESPLGADAFESLLAEPELWEAASAWRDHLAGPPRIAENVYSWTRPRSADRALLPPGLRNGA